MKYLCLIAAACAFVVSCEKPPSEAEKNAQIEREVQQRLAAERQADDQQRLAQQQADLDAREKALAEKEAASPPERIVTAEATPRATQRPDSSTLVSSRDDSPARSYDTFYRKLEPYGAWRESSDYGYVWQPREAQGRDWRPYTDGRWAYTDAGWTWISDEPFGWATYHYGRWTRLSGVGWVWVPGEDWAPAWVSWRKSDQHVGWAPLPPEARFERRTGIKKWADSYYDIDAGEYVFIPNEDIGDENVQRAVLPQEQNVTIVNETTNVTNITYNNTTIVNEGPDFNELRARSRQPFERKRIERQYNVEADQTPQAAVRGETIAMMTPLFTARAVERPRTLGAPIKQATVERATANHPDAERIRAKMRSEATPPPDAPSKKFQKPEVAATSSTPAPASGALPTPARSKTDFRAPSPTPVAAKSPSDRVVPTPPITPAAATVKTPATTPPRVVATATPAPTAAPVASPTDALSPPPRVPTLMPAPSVTPSAPPAATPANAASPSAEEQRRLSEKVRDERDKTRRLERRADAAGSPAPSATPSPAIPPSSAAQPNARGIRESDAARGRAAAAKAEQWRKQQEKRAENLRDPSRSAAKNTPTPAVSPQQAVPAAAPHQSPAPVATDPSERAPRPARKLPATLPETAATAAPRSSLPSASVTTPPAQATAAFTPTAPAAKAASTPVAADAAATSPTPTPSPTASKSKRALKPGKDKDVAAPPASPSATKEP